MSDLAIKAEAVSKRYRIGLKEELHDTLAAALIDFLTRPVKNFQRLRRLSAFSDDECVDRESGSAPPDPIDVIWALRGVSFEVKHGEVVGIIGHNGAGKTTLLKILSRITEPTSGRATICGRLSSLLEVGTGFHPDLTGRENIYLNGTMLGMSRAEIDRKFDAIVAFSGVEKFLDTPAKRYSSGMQVRLAFSVAAHLEPEILLIDEVLAVGDAEFQKRCLGKMREVTREGRTILFVSHNMAAIRNLCTRALLIEQGRLVMDAGPDTVIPAYLDQHLAVGAVVSGREIDQKIAMKGWDRWNNPDVIRCREIRLLGPDGLPRNAFRSDEEMTLEITYECFRGHGDFRIVASIVDENNVPILTTQNADDPGSGRFYRLEPGLYRSVCVFPGDLFGEKRFYVSIRLIFPHIDYLAFDKILAFDVTFAGYNNIQYLNHKESFLRPRLRWQTELVAMMKSMDVHA